MSVRSYEHAANGCCPRSTTTTVREILGSGVLNTARQPHADIEFGAAGEQLDRGLVPAIAPVGDTEGPAVLPSPCPLRAPHGRYRWSFTATHGEPKPLLGALYHVHVELFQAQDAPHAASVHRAGRSATSQKKHAKSPGRQACCHAREHRSTANTRRSPRPAPLRARASRSTPGNLKMMLRCPAPASDGAGQREADTR
jgi:hypothetical protein